MKPWGEKIIYSDNELDNALFEAANLLWSNPSLIQELINSGANVKAISKQGSTVLIDAIDSIWDPDNKDFSLIQLLIDLGADVNHEEEGLNCLHSACMLLEYNLVELLLKAGANPNCIGSIYYQTLYDWAYSELEEFLHPHHEEKVVGEILSLLRQYGAKHLYELDALKPEKFIWLAAYFPTGLVTATGALKIENLVTTDIQLVIDFNNWMNEYYTMENKFDHNYPLTETDAEAINKHADTGHKLAIAIREFVDSDVEILFMGYRARKKRKKFTLEFQRKTV